MKDKNTGREELKQFFITIYQNYWGRGLNPKDSRSRAQSAGGSGTKWVTYLLPLGAIEPYVTDMGGVGWKWDPNYQPLAEEVDPQLQVVDHGPGYKGSA